MIAAPAAGQPSPSPPVVIDGPTADITSLNGLSVARDGTGGLVYVKAVGAIPHVFVSALLGGQFQPPVEVDAGLGAASSQPVIAAGNGGLLLIGFINGGQLYAVQRANSSAAYGAPQPLAAGAINPSLQMSNFGKAYLAFTAADGAGYDVRTAYYANGSWALESGAMNAVAAADDAGSGNGAPQVATAGDGVGTVAWGEGGHVYSRRVWGTSPSVVDEQADVPSLSGCGEVSAGHPTAAVGGDSSYVDVAYQEVFACGAAQQARVLVNRLRGSQYDGAVTADGLSTPGPDGAADPNVVMGEYGQGFVTSEEMSADNVLAMELGSNGAYGSAFQANSVPGTSAPDPVPAIAGLTSDLIAWQQDPGSTGPAEIRVRYEPRSSAQTRTLGPEQVVSSPAQGPTDAARGLAASGDVGGDAAVAWVQGTGASTQIVAERMYEPPGAAGPASSPAYVRTSTPVLRWSPSNAGWGPITYTVTIDRTQVAQSTADAVRIPIPLRDGAHTWQVTASNPAGLSRISNSVRVFVDTVAPRLGLTVSGQRTAGSSLVLKLKYRDVPPAGLPARDASGVASLTIRWGDGTTTHLKPGTHRRVHVYRRGGRYTITVIVADRAGNQTRVVRHLKIKSGSSGNAPGAAGKHG